MPSFDIVSEIDQQEVDNALNQARKELLSRFDFKGADPKIEWTPKENKIVLTAIDASRLKSLLDVVIGKLAKRNVDLRNVDRKDPQVSSVGHARQEVFIKQGIEGAKAKEIVAAIKAQGLKVQSAIEGTKIRVTGKKRDDLQEVIGFCRSKDFDVALTYNNFRD
ncbi:MAG: YajQ family cyclic di-GMP-binding protein [Verrucomicrobia bacterium]|nr:YajQ family cyclic di-GMP-binding protein [Verrucomicrobiota bacterium]